MIKHVISLLFLIGLSYSQGGGYALDFDGSNDYVIVSNSIIPTSGDFSVSFCANTNTLSNSYAEIVSQGTSG